MLCRGPYLVLADESTPFSALQTPKAGRCLRRAWVWANPLSSSTPYSVGATISPKWKRKL